MCGIMLTAMEKQTLDFDRILDWYLNPSTHVEATDALRKLDGYLQDLFEEYFDRNYVIVEIMNQHKCRVIEDIKKEFCKEYYFNRMSFNYRAPNDYSIGTNYVNIAGDVWDSHPDIKTRLEKFDSFVGHHVESHKAMVPDENNEELQAYRKVYIGDGRTVERQVSWKDEGRRHPEWFVEKEIIDHEWTDELRVIDRRTYFKDDYSCKGRKIELY